MNHPTTCTPYEAAIAAVKRGWAVIPVHGVNDKHPSGCTCRRPTCSTPAKHPVEDKWQQSRYLSLADCYSLWMESLTPRNMGILTGEPSGVWVLDIDPRNGGNETLAALIAEHGELPETYTVRTGGGGRHYYFLMPDFPVGNSKPVDGIDIKGTAGQVLGPGSVSGSGTYWVENDAPVAAAPEWVLDLVKKEKEKGSVEITLAGDLPHYEDLTPFEQLRCSKYAVRVIEAECDAYATVKWGDGSDQLFRSCCNILEIVQSPWNEATPEYALQRLEVARVQRYEAAMRVGRVPAGQTTDELDSTWRSAAKKVRGQGRPLPIDRDEHSGVVMDIPFSASSPAPSGTSPFAQPGDGDEGEVLEGVAITEADRAQFAAAEAQAQWEAEVLKKKRELDILQAAKKLQRTEQANAFPEPSVTLLTDLLVEVDEGPQYRINGLWPAGGRVILAAQFKAGKSTLIGNVIRCLTDGDGFLGRGVPFLNAGETSFGVSALAPGEKVFLVDLELDRRTVRRWLGDQGIRSAEQVCVAPLRGRLGEFNVLDADRRAKWAELMRQHNTRVLIIDPLAPLLNSLGLDEKDNKDVGPLLDALDTLCEEAGIDEMLIAHHMGHSGDRSRGASRLRDWPDVEWKLIKEGSGSENGKEARPDAPRFFSAFGRDVLVQESKLDFDPEARRLFITGGDRSTHAAAKGLPIVIEIVRSEPGIATNILTEALQRRGMSQVDARKAIKSAVTGGEVHTYPGAKRAIHHFINDQCATPDKCASGVRLNFAAGEPTEEEVKHGLATIEAVFADLFPGTQDGVSEGKVRIHAMDDTRKLSVTRAVFDRAWDEALDKGRLVQVGSAKVYRWDALATESHR